LTELTKEDVAFMQGCLDNMDRYLTLFRRGLMRSDDLLYEMTEAARNFHDGLADFRMDTSVLYSDLAENDEEKDEDEE
jgi:hypothetical protein